MNRVALFDTSVGTDNLGDFIIMDYCESLLRDKMPESFFVKIPTHLKVPHNFISHLNEYEASIVCGTNLLSSKMNMFKQWDIGILDCKKINNCILMGVGWWQYQEDVNWITKKMLQMLLTNEYIHSVRDSYTEKKLKEIGIKNVINTSCPTMWKLSPDFCSGIPLKKASNVITTITDYNRHNDYDRYMLETLQNNYKKVYLWIQAYDDYNYVKELVDIRNIEFVMPNLNSFDGILKCSDIEYVGTRLHAGIRALNAKKRSLIVGIDNRAIEISKDTNLPVISRKDLFSDFEKMLDEERATKIDIPFANIKKWLGQFDNIYNHNY